MMNAHLTCRCGIFALALCALVARSGAGADYARPELLIEPAQLAAAGEFVILDARPRSEYDQGHVAQARWVDHAAWAKAFGQGEDAAGWSQRIGELGIGPQAKVVVYDDNLTKDAARIHWILRYWGVDDVRLLHGGWKGWQAGAHPTSTTEPKFQPAQFTAQARAARLATKDELLKSLEGGKLQIVDARSEKEFCGDEMLTNKRAGAIPGAKQLEWSDLIDATTHRFKPADELSRLFTEAGIDLNRPTATHCQSGGRAAVMAFALELMGADDVSNYYPSWAEWGNAADTPVVPGKRKAAR